MSIAYCTIASANYLPRVKVLKESLAAHNPDATLHILLCERPEIGHALAQETQQAFLSPADVCANWLHMAFYYNITEYNTALKPFLLTHLLDSGYDRVLYFDPDIEIFSALTQLETLIGQYDLVLTPHVCKPMPMDGMRPGIDDILRAGQFNLGFIGLAKSKETEEAIEWWRDVCREHCLFDNQHHFFVDQFWAAALPSFIQKFYCLRDPAYNMAYWNTSQRQLTFEDETWLVDKRALKFFHFSGLSADLTQISRHQTRAVAPLDSPLYTLLANYREKISHNAWSRYATAPYSFDQYTDGRTISPEERRLFLQQPAAQRDKWRNPFSQSQVLHALWHTQQRSSPPLYREYFAKIRTQGFGAANRTALRFLVRWATRHPKSAAQEKR